MDYRMLEHRITNIAERMHAIDGHVSQVKIEAAASPQQIAQCENKLGCKLPESFKQVLVAFSSALYFRWVFPDNFQLDGEFDGIFSGMLHWDLGLLKEINDNKNVWITKVFSDPDNDYDKVWHRTLAFYEVGNGDYIAFDLVENSPDACVIYLSHDDGQGHGYKLADNFIDLLDKWSRMAFVGGEDWQWLAFTANAQSGLMPDSQCAKSFRSFLKLSI
ncbi:SMI1/KNR4 family protein [Lysinibacillus sp. NPDC097195]|uniref:SMI1/KNR4 family protein n=1 Tax=Lysinibacillus sp. NPDC097195 TaxID=3364141 RepID=UPI0037F4B2C7